MSYKGDKRRPEDKKTSDANYDKIDWSRKADQTEQVLDMVDHLLNVKQMVQPKIAGEQV